MGEERMQKIRKYSAIYGRFDSKRKNDKPMSMHEVIPASINGQVIRIDGLTHELWLTVIAVGQWLVSGLHWSSSARQSLGARQKELSE